MSRGLVLWCRGFATRIQFCTLLLISLLGPMPVMIGTLFSGVVLFKLTRPRNSKGVTADGNNPPASALKCMWRQIRRFVLFLTTLPPSPTGTATAVARASHFLEVLLTYGVTMDLRTRFSGVLAALFVGAIELCLKKPATV